MPEDAPSRADHPDSHDPAPASRASGRPISERPGSGQGDEDDSPRSAGDDPSYRSRAFWISHVAMPVLVAAFSALIIGLGGYLWSLSRHTDTPEPLEVNETMLQPQPPPTGYLDPRGCPEHHYSETPLQGIPKKAPDFPGRYSPARLSVVLQSESDDPIVVTSAHVTILSRKISSKNPRKICTSGMPTRNFTVNLDDQPPMIRPDGAESDFPYKVSASDPEYLHIEFQARRHEVRFYLTIDWVQGGERRSTTLDNEGKDYIVRPVHAAAQ